MLFFTSDALLPVVLEDMDPRKCQGQDGRDTTCARNDEGSIEGEFIWRRDHVQIARGPSSHRGEGALSRLIGAFEVALGFGPFGDVPVECAIPWSGSIELDHKAE